MEWVAFFHGLFDVQGLTFDRCIKTRGAIGEPVLIIFADGSKSGFGCCAYIRWQTSGDTFDAKLLMAKNRIAPRKQLSIPRIELCGAVLTARLREKIVEELGYKFSKVVHITDSMIVRWQITKESYGFKTFVATRIGEIQGKTGPDEWWWVEYELNAAELTTRVTQPTELGPDSIWQKGPEFLEKPISVWPIYKVIPSKEDDVDRIGVTISQTINALDAGLLSVEMIIDINRFSKFEKLLHVTAIVKYVIKAKSFRNTAESISSTLIEEAEEEWIKCIQLSPGKDWEKRYRRLGPYLNSSGLIVIGKRMAEWLKMSWNQNSFVLLPSKSKFSILCVKSIHEEDHAAIEVTIAKVRRKYWIPKLKNIVKSIKNNCTLCRIRDKK